MPCAKGTAEKRQTLLANATYKEGQCQMTNPLNCICEAVKLPHSLS